MRARAGQVRSNERSGIYLGCFTLSKTDNHSNNPIKKWLYDRAQGQSKKTVKSCVKNSENFPPSENQTVDISHGRQIVRKVSVFNMESLKSEEFKLSEWSNIRRLIKVERSGTRGQKDYEHEAYYISSLSADAETFASKIRGHWLIENQLHWVKDVIFQEDMWPRHDYKAVTNLSILSTIALNLYRLLGFRSVKAGRRWLCSSLSNLILIFAWTWYLTCWRTL